MPGKTLCVFGVPQGAFITFLIFKSFKIGFEQFQNIKKFPCILLGEPWLFQFLSKNDSILVEIAAECDDVGRLRRMPMCCLECGPQCPCGLNLNFDPVHDFPFVLNSGMMCNYISGKIFQFIEQGICQRSSVLEKAIIFLFEFFSLKFRVRATLLIVPDILRDVGVMFAGINSECGKFTAEALQADSCMGIIKNHTLIVI